jgi:hypothetical protein
MRSSASVFVHASYGGLFTTFSQPQRLRAQNCRGHSHNSSTNGLHEPLCDVGRCLSTHDMHGHFTFILDRPSTITSVLTMAMHFNVFLKCNPGAWIDCKFHMRSKILADMHTSYDFEVPRGMTLPLSSCNPRLFIAGDEHTSFPPYASTQLPDLD